MLLLGQGLAAQPPRRTVTDALDLDALLAIGQLAVAQVIMNRVESGRFGSGVCGVVKAPKQFSFVRGGTMPAPTNMTQWETAKAVALIAISGSWPEVAPDATHFHATRVNPGWKLRRVATVGQHIFYR